MVNITDFGTKTSQERLWDNGVARSSRPWDKGGGGGGPGLQKTTFSALRASISSKNKGADPPGPFPRFPTVHMFAKNFWVTFPLDWAWGHVTFPENSPWPLKNLTGDLKIFPSYEERISEQKVAN